MKAHRSKFSGMVQDVSPTNMPQDKYHEARNMRVTVQDKGTTGSITTELGDSLLFKFNTIGGIVSLKRWTTPVTLSEFQIVGWTTMRNYLVIFTTSNYMIGEETMPDRIDAIFRLEFDKETNTIVDIATPSNEVTSDHLRYLGELNFSTDNPIEALARYEHIDFGKVYWVDYRNSYRHFNVMGDKDTGMDLEEDQLDLVSNIDFPIISVTETPTGGEYNCGVVQYSCMLYRKYGNATAFSPLTGMLPLHPGDEGRPSRYILGGEFDEETNKSVSLTIDDLDSRYDYIRIYSLYYSQPYSTPDIHLVGEYPIVGNSLSITDSGDFSKETLSLQEFLFMGGSLYIPYTLEVKDSLMMLGNIKEEPLILDFDARAYRFDGITTEVELENTQGLSKQVAEYDPLTTLWTVPDEDYDCIHPDQTIYKYDINGELGGSGPNVSYLIKALDLLGDQSTDNIHISIDKALQSWSTSLEGDYQDNGSYTDYTSVINAQQLVSYQRGETYRFGIVFTDSRGRKSFVHWIADIRMPDYKDVDINGKDFRIADEAADALRIAYVEFTINAATVAAELGSWDFSWDIVRVERRPEDKTVVGQGLILPITQEPDNLYGPSDPLWAPCDGLKASAVGGFHNVITPSLCGQFAGPNFSAATFILITPEFLYGETPFQYKPGDSIYVWGNTKTTTDVNYTPTFARNLTFKAKHTTPSPVPEQLNLQGGRVVSSSSETLYNIPLVVNKYLHFIYNGSNPSTEVVAYHDRAFIGAVNTSGTTLSDLITAGNFVNTELLYVNYLRTVPNQYGGNSYAARTTNEYKSCGMNVKASDGNLMQKVSTFGGDTYVGYLEYLRGFASLSPSVHFTNTDGDSPQSLRHIMLFPVESTYNLALTHGEKNSNTDKTNKHLMQPVPRSGENADEDYYSQDKNYYLYNHVYSKQNNAKTFYPLPLLYKDIIVQDVKMMVSERKFTYEPIDSWTVFGPNSFTELESSYGPLRKIMTLGDGVVTFQDSAVGIQAINERSLTQDQSGAQLVLGEGKMIGQHRYISLNSGTIDKFSVVRGGNGIYYYDSMNKSLQVLAQGEGVLNVSTIKGVSTAVRFYGTGKVESEVGSLLDIAVARPKGVVAVYDKMNGRVITTILNYRIELIEDESVLVPITETISYNELAGSFESFHDYKPPLYLPVHDRFIKLNPSNLNEAWLSDSAEAGKFFGVYHPSSVTMVVNSDPNVSKIVSNVMYISDVLDGDMDYFNETFHKARVWNGHQNTGEFELDEFSCRRLGRMWRFGVPRTITTTSSGTVVSLDRSRLVDAYAFIKLIYENAGKQITLSEFIATYYPVKYI